MIYEFLKKYQSEIFDEKIALENKIQSMEIKQKETEAFIDILEKSRDSNYESFTPHEMNHEDKEKISQLKSEKRALKNVLTEEQKKLDFMNQRFLELNELLIKFNSKSESNMESVLPKLKNICDIVIQDPQRAKIELKEMICSIEKNEK